ncbi:hypothetical protein [Candidatus Leptofilum sp.]|uniref:hypothetical protein n=1 Tax=Candidatus Leptofilum sp. TaxID=3241576 RepID=UPI003B5A3C5A
MKNWQRKYLVRFIIGMAGYSILLPISLIVVGGGRVQQPWLAILIALLPIAPFLIAMTATVQNVRHQDEMQHRIHLEAILVTTLLTGAITFSYGLLEALELVPALPTVLIAPFMIVVWGIANRVITRRYD